jgi:hypothetical protein
VVGAALVACGGDDAVGTTRAATRSLPVPAGAGNLVAATRLATTSETELRALLSEARLPSDRVLSGATAYRLRYRTVAPDGSPTTATGLVVLPRDLDGALPTVLYDHGTVVRPADAPSELATFEGRAVASLFSGGGFVFAAPDYLGLGRGRGSHPYLHARSEATASADLLRALRTFARDAGVELTGDVYGTGFSQGGQAVMAFGELVQRDRAVAKATGLRLRALAPVAGPLDLLGSVWPSLFDGATSPDPAAVSYLAQVLVSWNRIYRLYRSPRQIFAPRYAGTVEQLFDGNHTDQQVAEGLPDTVGELLRRDAFVSLRDKQGKIRAALRDNAVCTIALEVPVRIYQASGDGVVVPTNGRRCRARLAAEGVDVELTDLGDTDHVGAAYRGLPEVEEWFRQLADEQG